MPFQNQSLELKNTHLAMTSSPNIIHSKDYDDIISSINRVIFIHR